MLILPLCPLRAFTSTPSEQRHDALPFLCPAVRLAPCLTTSAHRRFMTYYTHREKGYRFDHLRRLGDFAVYTRKLATTTALAAEDSPTHTQSSPMQPRWREAPPEFPFLLHFIFSATNLHDDTYFFMRVWHSGSHLSQFPLHFLEFMLLPIRLLLRGDFVCCCPGSSIPQHSGYLFNTYFYPALEPFWDWRAEQLSEGKEALVGGCRGKDELRRPRRPSLGFRDLILGFRAFGLQGVRRSGLRSWPPLSCGLENTEQSESTGRRAEPRGEEGIPAAGA